MSAATLPDLDTIDAALLTQLRHDDPAVRILDVRTGGEFETMHIPGSYNVPLDTLGEHVADFAAVTHPVVLVCQAGGRASQAHTRLHAAGGRAMLILEGGMNAWTAGGGEVTRGEQQRWAMDRQVRLGAGVFVVFGVIVSMLFPKLKWLSAAVGAGLTYSAATDTCPVTPMIAKLPYNQTDRCDIEGVLSQLNLEAA